MQANTEKNTRWAVNTFETWLDLCNCCSNVIFAPDLLEVPPTDSKGQTELCCGLSLFVIEARKSDGELHTVRTNVARHIALYCDKDP